MERERYVQCYFVPDMIRLIPEKRTVTVHTETHCHVTSTRSCFYKNGLLCHILQSEPEFLNV